MDKAKGIVSAAMPMHDGAMLYSIMDSVSAQLSSALELELYDRVETGNDGTVLKQGKASAQEYEELLQKRIRAVRISANAKRIRLAGKPYRAHVKALLPKLSEAATAVARAMVSGAPMIVRFHNDGDGASGATALYRAAVGLQAKFGMSEAAIAWRMNKRIAYSTEELYVDRMFFNPCKSIEKPLLLVTDFGTSPESVQSLEAMKEIATVIVLDHHPPYKDFPRHAASIYINSWDFGADSDFTAGLLSSLLSELLCSVDVEDLKDASLICDYSIYARDDAEARKNALILDFMTASRAGNVKPASIDAVLMDKERREEVFTRANNMQEEALTEAMKRIKSYRSRAGINVFVLGFGHIAALNLEFPPLGRLTSILQKRMEALNNQNTVTVVHSLSNISIRVSGDIADKVKLLEVIRRMKSSVDYPMSGGGHMKASGISVESIHMSETIDALLRELGVEGR